MNSTHYDERDITESFYRHGPPALAHPRGKAVKKRGAIEWLSA